MVNDIGSIGIGNKKFIGDTNNNPLFVFDRENERLGIGTVSPTVALDVVGSALISGDLTVSGDFVLGDDINFGDDITFTKEVAHTVTVTTSTTAATAGGALTVTSGAGATSGAGGALTVTAGAGGATGAGGALALASGAGGATSGASGAVTLASGASTSGNTADVTISTGNAAAGNSGNIVLTPGTASSTVGNVQIGSGRGIVSSVSNGFFPVIKAVAQDNIAAGTGGAIAITNFYTTINTDAGGDAFTLANGNIIGQLKRIQLIVDGGGDAVITPTSLSGGTTITMADAADFALLLWNGTAWVAIQLGNDADGVTAPVLA